MPNDSIPLAVVRAADLLATYLLHSSLLLGAVWAALRIGHTRSPRLVEQLWKAAAIVPLMTAAFQIFAGVGNPVFRIGWGEPVSTPASLIDDLDDRTVKPSGVSAASPRMPSPPKRDDSSHEVASLSSEPAESAVLAQWKLNPRPALRSQTQAEAIHRRPAFTPSLEPASDFQPASPVTAPASVQRIPWVAGTAVSIAGSLFCLGLIRLWCQTWSFRRSLRACRPMNDPQTHAMLDALLAEAGVRQRVRILVGPALTEPAAFGVFRATIVLPAGIETRLTPDELRALLAHELAHFVRGDTRWLWIGRLLCLCLPIQPLNFVARRRWQAASEFLCDEWAVRRNVGASHLARCLIRVAEWRLDPSSAAALPAAGSPSTLTQRVERLLSNRPHLDPWDGRLRRRLLPAAVLAIAVLCGWLGPRSALRAETGEPEENVPRVGESSIAMRLSKAARSEQRQEAGTPQSDQTLLESDLVALLEELAALQKLLRRLPDDPEILAVVRQIEMRRDELVRKQRQLSR
jgi:beta-lactamase regulating signal transducer with metallopeptidase domain